MDRVKESATDQQNYKNLRNENVVLLCQTQTYFVILLTTIIHDIDSNDRYNFRKQYYNHCKIILQRFLLKRNILL